MSTVLPRLLLAAALCGGPAAGHAQDDGGPAASWVSTWGTASAGANNDGFFKLTSYLGTNVFSNQTVRLIVHTSLGGDQVRVRLSNEMGTTPVTLGAVRIAVSGTADQIVPDLQAALTFGGRAAVTIPAGAPVLSDAVAFPVPARSNLSISLYFAGATTAATAHTNSLQTNYVAAPGSGDTTAAETLPLDPTAPTLQQWPLLSDVQVSAVNGGTFVAFGSSITTGIGSTLDANRRWPDYLAKRFANRGFPLGVVNASIVANRLLNDGQGQNALARFDRDVLARPGVKYVLVTDEAGVDIISGVNNPAQNPSVEDLSGALQQLIERAHSRGVKIFAGTILPVEGFVETPESRAKRLAVNDFIRSGVFDGVADFEKIVLDPDDPYRLLPALDSGDHHHPNDEGYRRMAKAVAALVAAAEEAQP